MNTEHQHLTTVFTYHEQTKHHPSRYARALGYLDWDTQPDAFRRFEGAPLTLLPLIAQDRSPAYELIYTPGHLEPRGLTLSAVSEFLQNALAVSAWKEYRGNRWALRCNPSSGNLHPTEGYVLLGPLEGLSDLPGVYHYAPCEQGLEQRNRLTTRAWQELVVLFPRDTFFVGLSSVHWREAWKYGERAYRFCQQDVGHALAALCLSAAAMGWCAVVLDAVSDDDLAAALGLDRTNEFCDGEREHPDVLVAIVPHREEAVPRGLPQGTLRTLARGRWHGRANRLSSGHVPWDLIDQVAAACEKPATPPGQPVRPAATDLDGGDDTRCGKTAHEIFQQRRSAVEMDGKTGLTRDRFYRMLRRVVPDVTATPWDALGAPTAVHLGLFVHRVSGLTPGLYCLARDEEAVPALREAMHATFRWERPDGCPADLPLFFLLPSHCEEAAVQVSCQQAIAGDGAFSLGMLAVFDPLLRKHGAWFYRRLFWEAGMVGQVLYLEAEAAGLRATGMGCYFDDAAHRIFGIDGHHYQSVYHFTVGGPVEDPRITTRAAYSGDRAGTTG